MKEKIKKIIKPLLVVIIAGFIVSLLYITFANEDIKKGTSSLIKLPEISGYNYSEMESRIDDLEFQISNLEGRTNDNESNLSDLESRISDLEGKIDDLESSISGFKSCLRNWLSGVSSIVDDLWYCAGKLP